MTDSIKSAFDGIRAEDKLKRGTMAFLQTEMEKRSPGQTRAVFIRRAAAVVCVAAILLSGALSYNMYFTPSAYVDVDVNPSIGLTLNRFDRVIGLCAYNDDGEEVIAELALKNKAYDEAITALIDAIAQKGYMRDDGLVSVTLQINNQDKETEMLSGIQTGVADRVAERQCAARIEVYSVSEDTLSHAHELDISPAKYLAIQELFQVDDTVTVESCKGHSVSELRRMTQARRGLHSNGESEPQGDDAGNHQENSGHHGSGEGGYRGGRQ